MPETMKKSPLHSPRPGTHHGHSAFLFSIAHNALKMRFRAGDVYLFHRSDMLCPSRSSLWGQYDKREQGRLYLESSSLDLHTFRKWHVLPSEYRYCRRASRPELRDYISGLIYSECHTRPSFLYPSNLHFAMKNSPLPMERQ